MNDEYVDKSLDIIKKNDLLDQSEFTCLEEMKEDINHNFWAGQLFRSKVEMEVSVLNDIKHPTNDSKYWQAIREQNVHFSELVSLSYEYRKRVQEIRIRVADENILKTELKILTEKGPAYKWELEKRLAERELIKIDVDRMNWGLIQMTKTARDRLREITCWNDILQKLKPILRWSPDTYEEHQWASYRIRFKNQLENAVKSGANSSSSEMNNLIGLFTTMERVASGKGVQLNEERPKIELASDGKRIIA